MKNLTLKQKLFCEIFIENKGNATQAVIDAGYDVTKNGTPTRNSAKVIASQNLAKPHIQEYIHEIYNRHIPLDFVAQRELDYLIFQEKNLSVKARALDIYYKSIGAYKQAKCPNCRRLQKQLDSLTVDTKEVAKLLP